MFISLEKHLRIISNVDVSWDVVVWNPDFPAPVLSKLDLGLIFEAIFVPIC